MTTTEKVLDVLGLKPYERFQLSDARTYYFCERMILFREDIQGPTIINYLYHHILSGKEKIIHLPNE